MPRKRPDTLVDDIMVLTPRADTGMAILTVHMRGISGAACDKIVADINGQGYATFTLDERMVVRLFRELTGIVAAGQLAQIDHRLIVPGHML